jgi:hypothetical protein
MERDRNQYSFQKLMKGTLISGVVLVVLGSAMLGYGHFSYKKQEKILEVGPIQATAETTENVVFPPLLAWVLIGSGTCVLVIAGIRGTSS